MGDFNDLLVAIKRASSIAADFVTKFPEIEQVQNAVFEKFRRVIETMQPEERSNPQLFQLEPERIDRVAEESNVSVDVIHTLLDLVARNGPLPLENRVAPNLCDTYHKKMAAGTCPWCGKAIYQTGRRN